MQSGDGNSAGPPSYPNQDDRESIKIIRTAIEMGVNFIDTCRIVWKRSFRGDNRGSDPAVRERCCDLNQTFNG